MTASLWHKPSARRHLSTGSRRLWHSSFNTSAQGRQSIADTRSSSMGYEWQANFCLLCQYFANVTACCCFLCPSLRVCLCICVCVCGVSACVCVCAVCLCIVRECVIWCDFSSRTPQQPCSEKGEMKDRKTGRACYTRNFVLPSGFYHIN